MQCSNYRICNDAMSAASDTSAASSTSETIGCAADVESRIKSTPVMVAPMIEAPARAQASSLMRLSIVSIFFPS